MSSNDILMAAGGSSAPIPNGQASYTSPGTYSWTCPTGVTAVSVVCIGGGGGGANGITGGGSGGGGGLAYKNNIAVIPGVSYTVTVGSGGTAVTWSGGGSGQGGNGASSSFSNGTITVTATGGGQGYPGGGLGGYPSGSYDGGGTGGNGGGSRYGGGGAGGYSGNGGAGGPVYGSGYNAATGSGGGGGGGGGNDTQSGSSTRRVYYYNNGASGGGCGILGIGADGAGGGVITNGGAGSGGNFSSDTTKFGGGGGSGGSQYSVRTGATSYYDGYVGSSGAVRIIWGTGRSFPSTLTSDQYSTQAHHYAAGTLNTIYHSLDGINWTNLGVVNGFVGSIYQMAFASGTLVLIDATRTYRTSIDYGTTYYSQTQQSGGVYTYELSIDPTGQYVVFGSDYGYLHYSTNKGVSFTASTPGGANIYSTVYANGYFLYGVYSTGQYYKAVASTPGTSVAVGTIGSPGVYTATSYDEATGRIWASVRNTTYLAYSTDLGSTWNAVTFPVSGYCDKLEAYNGTVVAGILNSSAIYISVDNGATWPNSYGFPSVVYGLSVANGVFIAATGSGIYSSFDGISWNLRVADPASACCSGTANI